MREMLFVFRKKQRNVLKRTNQSITKSITYEERKMKTKKSSVEVVLFAILIVAYIAASLLASYNTKPEVASAEFPFSITYEYKGATKTLSGVLKCKYSGSETIHFRHQRYWEQETVYHNPDHVEEPFVIENNEEEQTVLWMVENMEAGYFMGDPQFQDYYSRVYGLDGVAPHVEYNDYKNGISLNDDNKEEVLASIGFKIVDCTYADPIENSFSLSGIEYEADNIPIFVAIMLVFLILCLIFVRKDKDYTYSVLDKVGIVLNFLLGFVAVPIVCVICMLFGIVESNVVLIDNIMYSLPSLTILSLALSIVFRRKGYSKTGFFIQFGTVLPIVLMLVLEAIYKFH